MDLNVIAKREKSGQIRTRRHTKIHIGGKKKVENTKRTTKGVGGGKQEKKRRQTEKGGKKRKEKGEKLKRKGRGGVGLGGVEECKY